MKKKRPYLLLELLIGIALLSLFALILIGQPSRLINDEIAALERIELERISEYSFGQVKQKLYRNEIPWENFATQDKWELLSEENKEIKLVFNGLSKERIFDKKIYLWTKSEKAGKEKEELHLLGIEIIFVPKIKGSHKKKISFLYRIFAKRIPDKIAST